MKTLLSFVLAVSLATVTFGQQTTDPTQDPTALGNAFFKALLDEDSNTLGKLVASDFSITSLDGNTTEGDMMIQGVSGGYVVVETGAVSDTRTRQYNSDTAVMTGTWKAKGDVQGQAFNATAVFSVVCIKQANAWKIVNVQLTPMHQ